MSTPSPSARRAFWGALPLDFREAINRRRVQAGLPPHALDWTPPPLNQSVKQALDAYLGSPGHAEGCDCDRCVPEEAP